MATINQCDLPSPASVPCCSLPVYDITLSLPELMASMKEGKVTFNGVVVKDLSHLASLYKKFDKEFKKTYNNLQKVTERYV